MTIIYFILILGIIVFVHELGHFIFAKLAKVYVYEFSLGMGPKIFSFKRKNDETTYSIRLFPIGGFVSMAGEEIEVDESIPKEMRMQSKSWWQRFCIVVAGVVFNFLLAFILLIVIGIVNGTPTSKTVIEEVVADYPFALKGIEKGDTIIAVNGVKVNNSDMLMLELAVNNDGRKTDFTIKKSDGEIEKLEITPLTIDEEKKTSYVFGFSLTSEEYQGFFAPLKYALQKTGSLITQVFYTLIYLITGRVDLSSLSGPVGIFSIVDASAAAGLINVVYLLALISINVGFINIIPLPAFDGGRLLFMVIELIRHKPLSSKTENIIHGIGLVLLLGLMVLITINDILRIFN